MVARLSFDYEDLTKMISLMHWRAENLVPQAVSDGERRARSYAYAGGREVKRRAQRGYRGRRRRVEITGSKIADMTERVFYHRFLYFFDRPDRDW